MVRVEEISRHKVHPNIPSETQRLRDQSANWLNPVVKKLHDIGIFKDIKSLDDIQVDSIEPLTGGIKSAAYWIGIPGNEVVIKFDFLGFQVESEWLRTYEANGVDVPRVLLTGTSVSEDQSAAQFIVLQGVVDEKKKRAKTGREVEDNPIFYKEVSRLMGVELAKIHSTSTAKAFGSYDDNPEKTFTTKTWQEFLKRFLDSEKLTEFGISADDVSQLLSALDRVEFPEQGSYISGDFALHNLLIEAVNPPKFKIIDPIGMIGDPYFDIATLYNSDELNQRLREIRIRENLDVKEYPLTWVEKDPFDLQSFLEAYIKESGITIDTRRLIANQIIAMIRTYDQKNKYITPNQSAEKQRSIDLQFSIRRELIKEKISALISS